MKTYGTAILKDNEWHINVEPHVAIRLKRVFPRLSKGSLGTLTIKATDETCRDLLWFSERFPLVFENKDTLTERASRYDETVQTFDKLITGQIPTSKFELAIQLRDYQKIAAELFLRTKGLLLADDLGTGKTACVIAGLSNPATWPALVVTMTHLPKQWENEIKKFCPELTTHIIKKGTPYDVRIKNKDGELVFPHVLISNYHKLPNWADSLVGVIKTVAFDEVQELRINTSFKYKAAQHIADRCEYKWAASATPIFNYGIEFFNVLSVLKPDALGSRSEFLTEWCRDAYRDEKASIKDPKAFGVYLRENCLMLRRTRAEVSRELPALTRVIQQCDADEDALTEAKDAASELARIILSKDTAWEIRGQATRELDWRMRQATGIAKASYVATFVKLLVESGEKVVLYGWHHAVYDLWLEKLKDFNPVMYTGAESTKQKEAAKEAFVSGKSKILIMSLRAGAGLDGLQGSCRTVVFGELDWTWAALEQCIGRIHRDGQTDPVMAYFLVSDSGSDPIMSEIVGLKKTQILGVIDPHAEILSKQEANSSEGIKKLAMQYLSKQDQATLNTPLVTLAVPILPTDEEYERRIDALIKETQVNKVETRST